MSPVERTMPAPKAPGKTMNIWLIVSIVLAVALVGTVAYAFMGKKMPAIGGGDKAGAELVAIGTDEAGNSLISFINEVYGERVGQVTLKGVAEKNGLYEVTFVMTSNGTPTDQIVFVTKDGKIFIPQVIDIAEMKTQFQEYQAQQQAAGTPAATAPTGAEAAPAPAPTPTPAE